MIIMKYYSDVTLDTMLDLLSKRNTSNETVLALYRIINLKDAPERAETQTLIAELMETVENEIYRRLRGGGGR